MAGNRAAFEQAMEQGHEAAQRGDWAAALQAALQAVQEFPKDFDACQSLAVALYHNAQYEEAIRILEDLRTVAGDHAVLLAYLARAYESNGAIDQAVDILVALGELAIGQRLLTDALDAFEEAVRLAPQRESLRIRVAEILVELGDPEHAVVQCIEIARLRLTARDVAGAGEALDEALHLDGTNRAAQLFKAELQHLLNAEPVAQMPASDTSGVPGAMEWTSASSQIIGQLVLQATAYQQAGDGPAALRLFKQAIDYGCDRSDVFYSLGVLYQEQGAHERAIAMLRKAAANDEYALSAHYALGNSLRATGDLRAAVEEYEIMLRLVNLDTVGRAEADDLDAMYRAAADTYAELGNLSRAASLYGTLADVFQSKRWGKELAVECRARAKEFTEHSITAKLRTLGTGMLPVETASDPRSSERPASATWEMLPSWGSPMQSAAATAAQADEDPFAALDALLPTDKIFPPVTPIDTTGCDDLLVRLVDASGRFIEQGLVWAAIDACHEVIRHDPTYLPVHLRLGEIYERAGYIEDALDKYRALIGCYAARGRDVDAIDVYYRIIDLAPESINVRTHLVKVLRQAKRSEEALDQALALANIYFKLGQTTRALEEFKQIQRWAPALPRLHKEYGQALLKLERWEAAQAEFRRAARLDPADPVALAQLNLTMAVLGQDERMIWDSFAALLQKLHSDPQHQPAVQAEYRTALLIVDVPILHYLLGLLQQAAGQHASALLEFGQALRRLIMEEHPQFAPLLVHQAMADSYLAEGQFQDALDQLQTVQRLLHDQATSMASASSIARPLPESELQRKLATAFIGLGQPEAAIEALLICRQYDPADPQALIELANIYHRKGELQAALEQYLALATLYEEQQQLDLAINVLQQATHLAPAPLSIRARLAHLLIRCGHTRDGLAALEEVAILFQREGQTNTAVMVLQQAAELWWMLSQHDQVQRLFNLITAWAPDHIEARQQLVNIHLLAGQYAAALAELRYIARICCERQDDAEALSCLEQIIMLDPNDADAYKRLGELQVRQQDDANIALVVPIASLDSA
jgi:tetratricopeptide (TPR) repeat protein